MSLAFNGTSQYFYVEGLTSAELILEVTLGADFSDADTGNRFCLDGRYPSNDGTNYIFQQSGTDFVDLGSTTNLEVDGAPIPGGDNLNSTTAPSGSVISANISDHNGDMCLFTRYTIAEYLPITITKIEYKNTGGTVLHSYDFTSVSNETITDNVGTVDAHVVGFTFAGGPTITGPNSTTEGAVTVQTGTLQDTIVTQSLISGSYSIEQTIDAQTATTLNYVAESGVNQCTPSAPVSGVPLASTISAAGITPYVVQQKADDGTNPPATRNITLNPEATHNVVQTMIAAANTTPGESFFGTNILTVEDNHQLRLPKVVDTVTITVAADGTFTTDKDQTISFNVEYFAPSTGEWYPVAVTVKDTSITPTDGEKKRKNRRQSQVYQYYLNKNWKNRFQG